MRTFLYQSKDLVSSCSLLCEKYEWIWEENRDKNGKLESYILEWVNTKFNTEICDDVSLINKVGQMYLKWLELEKEIKQKKYEMKLNRIKGDF